MKKIYCLILLVFMTTSLFAQQDAMAAQDQKSLWETITRIDNKTSKFNLYLNMHNSFNTSFSHGDLDQMAFKMDQLRIEARGNLNEWIYYRWRQRLNRSNNGSGYIDNLPNSIDYAAVGFRFGQNFSVFAGKQCAAYGGFEFDLNPIDIYEYSDMIDYMRNFMTGVNFSYQLIPTQEFVFQLLDSRTDPFEEFYGKLPETVEDTKVPLVYTLNWNGNFFDGMLKTRWSASIMNEAKHKKMYYYALGTELNIDKVNTFFDFMYSREGIDRKGIMTDIINSDLGPRVDYTAFNAKYMSFVWQFNYRVKPEINLFFKGMCETAGLSKYNDYREKGRYRTSWGYLGGIEYYPMKENLHFFLTYIGRGYVFTDRARELGFSNYATNRISIGFIYQLPIF